MRRHRIRYVAISIGVIILMMTGFAIALYLAGDAEQESATAAVLGTGMEPGRDLLTLLPSATPSPRPFLLTASPTPEAAPSAASPPPVPIPTQAPSARPAADPPPQPAPPQPPPAGWTDYEFAARVLTLVNSERTARGLAPLEVDPSLARAAQAYARLLMDTDSFGHEGPDGSTVASRIYGAGFPGPTHLAETLWLGVGLLPPEQVVSAWLASEPHRQNILSPVFRLAGIGCHFRLAEGLHARCVLDLAGG